MASSSVLVPVANLVEFNAIEAYRNYLMAVGVLFPNIHKAVELNVPSDDRLRGLALLYLNVLEQRLSFVQDINELVIHYYLIVTISSIIRIPKSYEYVQKIEELKRTSFQLEETNSESIAVKEKTSNCIVEQILGYLDTPMIQLPLPMNALEEAYLLFKLVESSNLVKLLDVHHTQEFYFKGLIEKELIKLKRTDLLSGLLDKKEAQRFKIAPLTNLGMESKVQEFKSSFFYSASEEIQIDVILRTINGFLNAYEGGKLFIGVDDRGDIIGLKHDLNYNEIPRTLDQYLNEIIATINKVYPKLIGTSYLDFKFHQVNGLDYLEIAIQPFDKPIPFRNVFYQRQGNRTIQLIGNDLVDFMEKVFKDQIEKTSGIQHELQPIDELAS